MQIQKANSKMENAKRREKLKTLVDQNFDEQLFFSLLREAHRRFLCKYAEEVVKSAVEHFYAQIERGNLNWVLDTPNPRETITLLLLKNFLIKAISEVWQQIKPSRGSAVMDADVLGDDGNSLS
jgi:hypothetical protein